EKWIFNHIDRVNLGVGISIGLIIVAWVICLAYVIGDRIKFSFHTWVLIAFISILYLLFRCVKVDNLLPLLSPLLVSDIILLPLLLLISSMLFKVQRRENIDGYQSDEPKDSSNDR